MYTKLPIAGQGSCDSRSFSVEDCVLGHCYELFTPVKTVLLCAG